MIFEPKILCHLKMIFSLWPKYLIFVFCLCPSEESGLTPQHMINTVIEIMPCYFFNLHDRPIFFNESDLLKYSEISVGAICTTVDQHSSTKVSCCIKLSDFLEIHTNFHFYHKTTSWLVELPPMRTPVHDKNAFENSKSSKIVEKWGQGEFLEPPLFDFYGEFGSDSSWLKIFQKICRIYN